MFGHREERRFIKKRAAFFGIITIALSFGIIARLIYLQVFKAEHYRLLSDKNRIVTEQMLPNRGNILDSRGEVLATNKISYSAIIDLLEIPEAERFDKIQTLLKLVDVDVKARDTLENLPEKLNRRNRIVLLKDNLSWAELSRFYIISSRIPGISIEKTQSRHYNFSEMFSHILGYIGSPTKDDIESTGNSALYLPTAKIGKSCVEKIYNEKLFGNVGLRHIEVNARRQFVREIDKIEPISGKDIKLTIDLRLQKKVYEILSNEQSASCVVMDIETGKVLAYVSYPGYDLNIFNNKVSKDTLKEIYSNPFNPMINKVSSGLYAPGSAFKMIVGLAALKKGIINKNTRFYCDGCYELGKHKFHCWRWKYGGHGSLNLREAISQSCDVFFYNLARMLTPEEIEAVAKDFGLGVKTGIDIPYEKAGLIPNKSWKKNRYKQSWTTGDTVNMSIGQGYVLSTPLQLAMMTSLIANGGKVVTPHICEEFENPEPRDLGYSKEHMKIITDGMYDVVNSYNGTAARSAILDGSFKFAGKTGSSQVFRITEKLRKEGKTVSDDYWMKEHAVFVGFAPFDKPKVAISVLVEHGGGGAKTAAPIARDVLISAHELGMF